MSSELVLDEVDEADRLAKQAFEGTGISVLTTGSGRLFGTLDRYLVDSQLSSFGTAFLTVFAVIFIIFRSARYGFLAIPPNVLPVIIVLGVMGFLDISLNIATVMVASVALGVVDDDTIHFINRYRKEVDAGATTDQAIAVATTHEGRAALTSAIINSAGFAVLLTSEYKPTAWFGGLLALTMAVAFLAEVFLLPAIIKLLPGTFGHGRARGRTPKAAAAALVLGGLAVVPAAAQAQAPTGHVSLLADYLPHRQDTAELRARVFAEHRIDPAPGVRLQGGIFVEGLLARRPSGPGWTPSRVTDAIVRVQDATISYSRERFALDGGFGRLAWGRLDELQPTDVINPLDVSRFFFEGRSEARLPVGYARGRLFLGERATIEGVYVPFYRGGRFDQLDEPTSPFNLVPALGNDVVCLAVGCPPAGQWPIVDRAPSRSLEHSQGGARVSVTSGRVDWSVSAWRGIEPFGFYEAGPIDPLALSLIPLQRVYPRFTMIGGDFETVRGAWGVRGEAAVFVDDAFQGPSFEVVRGHSLDAGAGVDRRAGSYRVSGTVLLHRERYDEPMVTPAPPGGSFTIETDRTDVSFMLSAERTFARERYRGRVFAVSNPSEGSGFLRGILTASLGDNLALEGSAGWFLGSGRDTIGRFADSDFVYARLKAYF
jgi:hypothetical protein